MCMLAHTLPRLGESDRGLTRSAVSLLAGDEPSPEKAQVLGMHALSVAIENTDPQEVLEAAAQAIDICDLLGLPEPALALHCRADARLTLGDPGGLEDYERAVAAARAQGLGRERATIELNRAASVFALEGPRAACRATVEGTEFARRHGLETYVTDGRAQLIAGLRDAGEWDRALEDAADILSLIETDDDVANALYVKSFQVHMLAERGDAAQAAGVLPWMVEKGRESTSYLRGNALLGAALAYAQIGEADTTLSLLAECLGTPAAVLCNQELVPCAVRAALSGETSSWLPISCTCIAAGTAAPRTAAGTSTSLPPCGRWSRRLTATYEAAAEGFADAAGQWRTFEMPYEEGQALLGQGRCLVRLGRQAEAVEALEPSPWTARKAQGAARARGGRFPTPLVPARVGQRTHRSNAGPGGVLLGRPLGQVHVDRGAKHASDSQSVMKPSIHARMSGRSMRWLNVTPMQFQPLSPKDWIASTLSVPRSRVGHPESPGAPPPFCRPGLTATGTNSRAKTLFVWMIVEVAHWRCLSHCQSAGPGPFA